jgi:hypothetical protein
MAQSLRGGGRGYKMVNYTRAPKHPSSSPLLIMSSKSVGCTPTLPLWVCMVLREGELGAGAIYRTGVAMGDKWVPKGVDSRYSS